MIKFGVRIPEFATDGSSMAHLREQADQLMVVVGAGCALTLDATATLDAATGDAVSIAFHGDAVVRGTLLRSK